VVSGRPTAAGSTVIVLRATDALAATGTSGLITITVAEVPDLAISMNPTLPPGEVDTAYSKTLQTTGGYGAKTWAVTDGAVPDGLELSAGGVVSGMPTTAQSATFTATATDSEARTASRAFGLTIVAAGTAEGPHDYFEFWQQQPEHHHYSNSLRTAAQIQSVWKGTDSGRDWSYDAEMDAAKVTPPWPNASGSWSCKQLKFPANSPTILADRIVLVWDWYWPVEFRVNCGGVTNFKTFQVQPNGKGWWTNMNNQGPARNFPANVGFTITDEFRSGHGKPIPPSIYQPNGPDGMESSERVQPAGAGTLIDPSAGLYTQLDYDKSVPVDHSVWHRVIIEVRMNQPPSAFTSWSETYLNGATLNNNPVSWTDNWFMVSKWYMSETMPPTRVLYQVPMGGREEAYYGPITSFTFEMNSSKENAIGPMSGWGRNVLVLKNLDVDEDDTRLFRQPVR
jgi:hypothetical protein